MNRRRALVAAIGLMPMMAFAKNGKMPHVALLFPASASAVAARVGAFRDALRELGYIEGTDVALDYRYADGNFDRLARLAAELVALKVDVIVAAGGDPPVQAAKAATRTIPIVMVNPGDPVRTGLVASLAHPGGNVTGLSSMASLELYGKQVELLREIFPRLARLAVLSNPDNPISELALGYTRRVAAALQVQVIPLYALSREQIGESFASALKARAGAVQVVADPMYFGLRAQVAEHAARSRLPAIYAIPEYMEVGGLMAYSANGLEMFRRAAVFVDKILKGGRPADLPVEQPVRFELALNMKVAAALGIILPQSILLRADRVIE